MLQDKGHVVQGANASFTGQYVVGTFSETSENIMRGEVRRKLESIEQLIAIFV